MPSRESLRKAHRAAMLLLLAVLIILIAIVAYRLRTS
jgi:hypothetical protein